MKRFARYGLLSIALLALALLAPWLGHRLHTRTAALRSLDDWDIPELADHLNRAGLDVQLRSTLQNGTIGRTAYLTTLDRDWDDLSRLRQDPRHIHEWRGIVFCERVEKGREPSVFYLRGDHCLVAGPFVLCGDVELLKRIRAILVPSIPPAVP